MPQEATPKKDQNPEFEGWKHLTPGQASDVDAIITGRLLLMLKGLEGRGQIGPFPGQKGPDSPHPDSLLQS